MSSGLTYTPGMYADTGELAALCEVVAEFGGFYAPHTRSYGAGALEAYAEMIDLARTTGCALHLTHATMNFGVNRGRAPEFLDMVDAALADGCDITPGHLSVSARRHHAVGSAAELGHVGRPGCGAGPAAGSGGPGANHRGRQGERLRRLPRRHRGVGHHPDQRSGQPRARRVRRKDDRHDRGATADLRRSDVFFDLLERDTLATTILQHVGHEENVRAIMVHPKHMGGSDAILVGERPHPTGVGHLPALPGPLRPRARPAEPRGLRRPPDRPCRDNGFGSPTAASFAPATPPTWCCSIPPPSPTPPPSTNPEQQAPGISHVIVNGECAIEDGRPTGRLAGRALRMDPSRKQTL